MRRTTTTPPRRLVAGLVASGLCAGLVAIGSAAPSGASSAHAGATPLQQGLAFYRNKTLTLIAPASPGGGPDLNARLVAPYLESYLHCQVNIEDNGSGGGYPAEDAGAAAAPDGLTIGIVTSGAIEAQLAHQLALNFNPVRETFLATGGPSVSIWVASPSSPYRSFSDVVDAPAPVTMLTLPNGVPFLENAVMYGIYGVKARFVYYPTTAALLQGFLRGDGPLASLSTGMVGSAIVAGQARPLLVTSALPPEMSLAASLRGVPTVAQYAKAHPPKGRAQRLAMAAFEEFVTFTGSTFFVPPRTPAARVAALRAALKYALGPVTRAQAISEQILPGYVSGAQAKLNYLHVLAAGKYLAQYLGS